MVRPFPIVNYARTIGGQVGDPAFCHETIQEGLRAVLDKVRAEKAHHTGAGFARGSDVVGAPHKVFAVCGRKFCGWGSGIDEGFLDARHAISLGERVDF